MTEPQPTGQIVQFAPARRKGSHVLIGVYGFSGCGKTLSALYIARGMVGPKGRIAMIDTETGRGLVYANEAGGFDHAELTPPFTPERYVAALKAAEDAGYEVLIIDSASHLWQGIGGVIEMADASNREGLVKWANPKARYKKWVNALLNTRMHVIVCLRAKEKMKQVKNPQTGKQEIVSEGFVAIQEKGFIYEMTAQLFLPLPVDGGKRGVPVIEKCPKDLLNAFPAGEQISIATGEQIAEWVAGGAPVDHALDVLRRQAEEAAEGGSKAFAVFWNSDAIKGDNRARLRPFLDNLKSIAKTADEEAERIRFKPADQRPDDIEENPFGREPEPRSDAPPHDLETGEIDQPTVEPFPLPLKSDGKTPDGAALVKAINDELAIATADDQIALIERRALLALEDRRVASLGNAVNLAIAKRRAALKSEAA